MKFNGITQLTLPKVSSIQIIELVHALSGQCTFKTVYKVIAVQKILRSHLTRITRSDRRELERGESLSASLIFPYIHHHVLCVGGHYL